MSRRAPDRAPVRRRRSVLLTFSLLVPALGVVFLLWTVGETRTEAARFRSLFLRDGEALAEAVGHAVEHALQAGTTVEDLALERLLDQARLLERLDAAGRLGPAALAETASLLGLSGIELLDSRLRIAAGTPKAGTPADDAGGLGPLLDGTADQVLRVPRDEPGRPGSLYRAAVRRERGGVLRVTADASELQSFLDEVGPENLMSAVAATGGIRYSLLEDGAGRTLARVDSPAGGPAEPILEFERKVAFSQGSPGRIRIGISAAALAEAERTGARRNLLTGLLVFGLVLALTGGAVARERYLRRLERESARNETLAAFGRLAAMVAHEVRNPLNAISVGVQRLEREVVPSTADPAEVSSLTRIIRAEIERLDRSVTRFLELARPTKVDPQPGDLAAAVREILPLLRGSLPSGALLRESVVPSLPARFDAGAVRQVLLNLVRNAGEALDGRGTVSLSARREGGMARLEVSDDGPGVPPANHDRIFEFGFTTRPGGSGLGLPIVQRLVAQMEGKVTLESTPGRGTRVTVDLPLAPGRADSTRGEEGRG